MRNLSHIKKWMIKTKRKSLISQRKHDKPVQDPKPSKTADLKPDSKPEKRRDLSASPVRKHSFLTHPKLFPAPVWSLSSSRFLIRVTLAYFLQTVMLPLSLQVLNQLHLCIPVTGTPLPELVLSQRIQALNIMKFSDDETFDRSEGASRDNCLIPPRHQNRQKKCHTGRLSGRRTVIWVGTTSRLLKPLTRNLISLTIPGRERTPGNRLGSLLPCHRMTGYVRSWKDLTAVEGYPSRSQDSAGLKRDQFIKVPKSQSKWYSMHLLKPEGPQTRSVSF